MLSNYHIRFIQKNNLYNKKINLPNDFDSNIYKSLNQDLVNLLDEELKNHYTEIGFKENREYKINSSNFNPDIYRLTNSNLINFSDEELVRHHLGEYRFTKLNNKFKYALPNDFNPNIYKSLYSDLQHLSD